MTELLLAADIEVEAITELIAGLPEIDAAFTALKVATKIPNPRPLSFMRVIAAGGSSRDLVSDRMRVTVEGWSDREGFARLLCASGVAVLERAGRRRLIGSAVCYSAEALALPANLPYPGVTDRFRFVATVEVDVRKSAV